MNKNSEFLQIAKEKNKIKSLEEAFKEFPPEEEWHQGKIENVLREEDEEYQYYQIGDIVYVNYYHYKNGTLGNNHFFVIIEQNNLAVPIESFGMLISSNLKKLKYKSNVKLNKDNRNHLKVDSIVKTDVIYPIRNENILFKIGEVSLDKVEEYKRLFLEQA